jgi:hypothetical protein
MLLLPAPSQSPPFSRAENGGGAIAHGKGGKRMMANRHVSPFLPAPVPQVQVFLVMGEEQMLMEMEVDIL